MSDFFAQILRARKITSERTINEERGTLAFAPSLGTEIFLPEGSAAPLFEVERQRPAIRRTVAETWDSGRTTERIEYHEIPEAIYADYRPQPTGPHTKEDLPIIQAVAAYLRSHSPEALLRCVASGAIEAQREAETDAQEAALGWLAWKANLVADGTL